MDWKMIILALFFASLDGQRTDCNPFQINRLETLNPYQKPTLTVWTRSSTGAPIVTGVPMRFDKIHSMEEFFTWSHMQSFN